MGEYPIVVGFDGEAGSGAALRWALSEAARRGLGVRMVHVVAPESDPGSGVADAKRAMDETGWNAVADPPAPVAVSTLALSGPVAGTLCDQTNDASMVVLGSRGLGGFAGLLLGSVSVAVAAHAHCPVVVVRDGSSVPGGGPVLVGVDDSDEARLAVEFAFAEAALRGVDLLALHATDRGADPRPVLDEVLRAPAARHPGVTVRTRTLPGMAGQALAECSDEAQLLVVGSRGRGGFHGLLLGSVSQQVLHWAKCPVAVVRRYPRVPDTVPTSWVEPRPAGIG